MKKSDIPDPGRHIGDGRSGRLRRRLILGLIRFRRRLCARFPLSGVRAGSGRIVEAASTPAGENPRRHGTKNFVQPVLVDQADGSGRSRKVGSGYFRCRR